MGGTHGEGEGRDGGVGGRVGGIKVVVQAGDGDCAVERVGLWGGADVACEEEEFLVDLYAVG